MLLVAMLAGCARPVEPAPAGEQAPPGVEVTGKVVSSNNTKVSSFSINGKTHTKVSVTVDQHPEIKRTFAFPVEVTTEKTKVEGVDRTEVRIIRKEGGAVVEKITL
jgi:hypothetical protein